MSDLPDSWAEVYDRLGRALGSEATAEEWVRQALEQTWGAAERRDLPLATRALALQRLSGVLLTLEAVPRDLAFEIGVRDVVGDAFARYFGGVVLPGPPWRLDPTEELPSHAEWEARSDFGEVAHAG